MSGLGLGETGGHAERRCLRGVLKLSRGQGQGGVREGPPGTIQSPARGREGWPPAANHSSPTPGCSEAPPRLS